MKYSSKEIWVIVYPVLFSLLMEHMINMTDTAFLGRVGEVELGASALGGVYYLAIYMLAFGFSIGLQILIGRRNGEGHFREIGPIFQQGLWFLLAVAGVLFTVSKLYSPLILRGLIHSDAVYQATINYMDWRVYGFFFSFVAVLFRAFFVGITRTKILTSNAIVMVLTNIVLNYALIFGHFGFPQLGIAGAAIASSIAELVSMLFFVVYVWLRGDHNRYGLFRFSKFDPHLLRHVLGVSVWTMAQYFLSVSTWFLFFVAVEHLGERPLAITNVVRSVSALLFLVVSAYATATSSLVSNLMGANQTRYVMGVCWRTIRMCYLFVVPLMGLIFLFPELVLRIYTDDMDLIVSAIPSLRVMVSVYLFFSPALILFSTISGTGNTRSALFVECGVLSIYMIAVYMIVVWFRMDVAVCWTVELIYAVFMLLFSGLYLKYANWRSKRI